MEKLTDRSGFFPRPEAPRYSVAGLSFTGSRGTIAVLVLVTGAAWLGLVGVGMGMSTSLVPFLVGWTVMMTAMMLPSVAPLLLLHRRARRGTTLLAGGYLLVWAATGVAAYAAARFVDLGGRSGVAAVILIAAGLYQLTPLKIVCLRRCRNPRDFLMQRWHGGRLGVMRLGLEHGVYCVGCCWVLMVVLVLAGAMSLAWAAVIAVIVFAEKVLPRGEIISRVLAGGLVAFGLATAAI